MVRLSNKLPVTVNVVLPLGDHQVNSVEIVEIHEAVLSLWAIFVRYSEQQMNIVYMYQLKDYSICLKLMLKKRKGTVPYSR
jgi:hypothetical protein